MKPRALVVLSVLTLMAPLAVADDLPFEKRLKDIAAGNPGLVELTQIGSSRKGRPLHLLKLSDRAEGNAERPSLVIVAGINGMHRVGVDVAVGLAEKVVAGSKELLQKTNIYIIPCVNPDTLAWQLEGGHPKVDWSRTIVPQDADRDGRVNEDAAEDLNGDGVISLMRIKDPKPGSGLRAEYCIDPENQRLLKRPDAAKGERAVYALMVEGSDNDGDGKFNEDGVGGNGGGVDLDKNFPYRWPEYSDGAGAYQLCEPESLALVDWMLKQKNIAAVLVYGPGDTLVNVPQAGKFDQTQSVPLGIEEGDKAAYEEVSKIFKEATNQTGAPTVDMAGSFQGWAYAQFGALSFETPVWVRPDLVKKEEPKKEGEKPAGEGEKKPEEAAAAGSPAELTPEQIRARMEQFQNATPEERAKLIQEFQNLPPDVRERMMPRGGGGRGGGGGQPGGAPGGAPGGGGRGGRGGRGGGPGGGPSGGGAAASSGRPAGEPSGDDAKWLKYDETQVSSGATSGFVDWKPFKHPQLGEVEIGGFVPGFKLNPPESELARLADEQSKFINALVGRFPKVKVEEPVVEKVGDGLWRISVRVVNEGAMATMTAIGAKARRETPTIITIDVPVEKIVAGEKINRTQILAGNGGKAEAQWLIPGEPGSTVNIQVRPTIGPKISVPVKLEEAPR